MSTLDIIKSKITTLTDADAALIASYIDNLVANPRDSIENLVKNRALKRAYVAKINTAGALLIKKAMSKLYNRVTSDQFLELVNQLDINGAELKQKILNDLDIHDMFIEIDKAITKTLAARKTNSSIVYLSADNVRRSQVIEELGITDYGSILRNFESFELVPKNSSSNSLVLKAKLTALNDNTVTMLSPLFMKIFPIGDILEWDQHYGMWTQVGRHETDGLDTEIQIYQELFKLAKYNVTPNILCKAALSENIGGFDAFIKNAKLQTIEAGIMRQLEEYNNDNGVNPDIVWEETSMIMTQPGGRTFEDTIRMLSLEDRRKVMFQFIYTLYVFEKIQFSHGDLHIGNMFIVDVPETELVFLVNGQQYRFKTTKLLKIYDFDHSMIGKNTSIKINTDDNFVISEKLNSIRDVGEMLNTNLAETNIFNKNLDIVIFLSFMSGVCPRIYNSFDMFSDAGDAEFDQFIRDCFPGFDSANPVSDKTIRQTYTELLTANPDLRYEANRIFDIHIANASEIGHYAIQTAIMNKKWKNYFKNLQPNLYGRIIKSTEDAENNNLWIPDTIIIPKENMLQNGYFASLRSAEDIDIRKEIVYTLDGRL